MEVCLLASRPTKEKKKKQSFLEKQTLTDFALESTSLICSRSRSSYILVLGFVSLQGKRVQSQIDQLFKVIKYTNRSKKNDSALYLINLMVGQTLIEVEFWDFDRTGAHRLEFCLIGVEI